MAILLLVVLISLLCCVKVCCWSLPKQEGVVCLNFVEFKSGRRWYRKGVPVSTPIKLLSFDVADMMGLSRESTSLWLQEGKRLKWCYRVGDYGIDSRQDIFVVERKCNSLCSCFGI